MRRAIGPAAVGLLGITVVGAAGGQALSSSAPATPSQPPLRNWTVPAPAPSPLTRKWIELNGPDDLERLRMTHFNHYLRAQAILAAANEICQPSSPHSIPARFSGAYPHCESLQWLTSNPPKKRLTFHLDDVGYSAVIAVTVSGGRMEELGASATGAK